MRWIVLWLFSAILSGNISKQRGNGYGTGCLVGALLGPIGILIALLVEPPDEPTPRPVPALAATERVTGLQHDQARRLSIRGLIVVALVIVLVSSLGVFFVVVTGGAGSPAREPAPSGHLGALANLSPVRSTTDAPPAFSVTTVVTPTQSSMATPSPPVHALTATPLPSPVLPTPTAAPSPTATVPTATLAPTATVAPPTPTVAPPTATPAVSLSRVTAPRASVYDGPSTTNSIIGGVNHGDELVVLGSRGPWYLVRLNRPETGKTKIEGGQGWIAQNQVSPPAQPVPVLTP